jgi:membrane-associated protease RseP (regulator of RpoE activity)
MGQLDGGRITHSVWGRRAATRINVITTLVLGLAGIIDSLALYWILFVLFLQRGPISPQQDEVSEPDKDAALFGALLLFIPFLTLLPYPADVTSGPFGPM